MGAGNGGHDICHERDNILGPGQKLWEAFEFSIGFLLHSELGHHFVFSRVVFRCWKDWNGGWTDCVDVGFQHWVEVLVLD